MTTTKYTMSMPPTIGLTAMITAAMPMVRMRSPAALRPLPSRFITRTTESVTARNIDPDSWSSCALYDMVALPRRRRQIRSTSARWATPADHQSCSVPSTARMMNNSAHIPPMATTG